MSRSAAGQSPAADPPKRQAEGERVGGRPLHALRLLPPIHPAPARTYIGYSGQQTPDLRLHNHNTGSSPVTRPHKPWKLVTYMVFPDQNTARRFETYCHTGSGKAWAGKHIFNAP